MKVVVTADKGPLHPPLLARCVEPGCASVVSVPWHDGCLEREHVVTLLAEVGWFMSVVAHRQVLDGKLHLAFVCPPCAERYHDPKVLAHARRELNMPHPAPAPERWPAGKENEALGQGELPKP